MSSAISQLLEIQTTARGYVEQISSAIQYITQILQMRAYIYFIKKTTHEVGVSAVKINHHHHHHHHRRRRHRHHHHHHHLKSIFKTVFIHLIIFI